MRRNAIAWVAIVISTAALIGSQNWSRPLPAQDRVTAEMALEGQKEAKALSAAFQAVAEYVRPSVVQISVARPMGGGSGPRERPQGREMNPEEFEEFMKRFRNLIPEGFGPEGFRIEPQQFQVEGTGSGFVYDDQGHILTNNHVVEGARNGDITVSFHDGTTAKASVVGRDPQTDVAVIKVDRNGYRAARIGSSEGLKVGSWVLAIGSPFGLSQTVTAGIISATHRDAVGILGDDGFEDFIQTDASINPGNSGGPLVDIEGQVIGINSAIATRSRVNAGVGFAIPISLASQIADALIRDGKVQRAQLGVGIRPLDAELAISFGLDPETRGILIQQVFPDSPADKAGLQEGDIIVGFGDDEVVSMSTFRLEVASSEIGAKIPLKYLRNGRERTTEVVLVPRDTEELRQQQLARIRPERDREPEPEQTSVDRFGIAVQKLTTDLANQLGHEEDAQGVIVRQVTPGSPAAEAGIEPGDLITRVVKDRKIVTINTLDQFEELVKDSDEMAVYIQSPDGSRSGFVPLRVETD
ncbi:DegQ family serine endoprotease [soil metagenome]